MKNLLCIALLLLFSEMVFCQTITVKEYESEELQDTRRIKIHIPTATEKDSLANYPLTIVLDGDYLFDLYVGNTKLLTYTDRAPKQIIVGIQMANTRNKDASINSINSGLTADSRSFYLFLKEELIPYLEDTYNTSPFITIVGSGITANLITHFLKDENPIINAYICLNPTFNSDINQQLQSYNLDKLKTIDNTYYFYLNSTEQIGSKKHANITVFNRYLQSLEIPNFNIRYDYLENSPNAVSAIGEAIPRALSKVFELYASISKEEFETKIKPLSPLDAISYLENKYLEIEYLFGTNIGIRERDIFTIEQLIIDKKNGDSLKIFGKMILKLYPKSPLGNYYLGLYYETGKKNKKALKQYRTGYGKMDPSDPNADKFYENVERMLRKE
ncbi:MAG: alpha/beta hydrolase-fold protein [Polaribacter sp.]|nr:alpha/beta hydrolase-fold protein [Polaribacter sp.]